VLEERLRGCANGGGAEHFRDSQRDCWKIEKFGAFLVAGMEKKNGRGKRKRNLMLRSAKRAEGRGKRQVADARVRMKKVSNENYYLEGGKKFHVGQGKDNKTRNPLLPLRVQSPRLRNNRGSPPSRTDLTLSDRL